MVPRVLILASWAALTACTARVTPTHLPISRGPALVPLEPSEVEHELDFERRLAALRRSPACDGSPSYAVLDEDAPRRAVLLGFCDGRVIRRPASGGLVVSGASPLSGPPPGWEARAFALGSMWVRTELPAQVRVRSGRAGVRLAGMHFDLHLRSAGASETPGAPEGCAAVASGARFVICRRSAHHVVAWTTIGSEQVIARSHPRMRATLRQAEDMVRAVQLMHRSGR